MVVTGLLSYAAYNPGLSRINDTTHGKGAGFDLFSWPTYRVALPPDRGRGRHPRPGAVSDPAGQAVVGAAETVRVAAGAQSRRRAGTAVALLLLVGGAGFEFATCILNTQQWYVFPGSFYTLHLYGAGLSSPASRSTWPSRAGRHGQIAV